MSKVLFLDIDGPLVNIRAHIAFKRYVESNLGVKAMGSFDPVAIALINKICQETGALIVVSSTWRYMVPNLLGILKDEGIDATFHTDWQTPIDKRREGRLYHSCQRGDEVDAWLDLHDEVEIWCAIDDSLAFSQLQANSWVIVDENEGLTYKNYKQAIKILGIK